MTELPHAVSDMPERNRNLARGLWAVAGLCIVAAGLLLWSQQGEAVFSKMLSAAIAWCF